MYLLISIIVFFILKKMYLTYTPEHLQNCYIAMFVIIFFLSYRLNKNIHISLLLGLLIVFGRTIYRYTTNAESIKWPDNAYSIKNTLLFVLAICFPYVVNNYKKNININVVKFINFILLFYVFFSSFEHILHRYVMHLSKDNILYKILEKNKFLKKMLIQSIRDTHIQHHLEVEKNMEVKHYDDEESLYMGWTITIWFLPLTIIVMNITKKITGYNISQKNIFISSAILAFVWQYIWNKTHVQMHNIENNYSIKKGPYDEGLMDLSYVTKLLYTNHKNHHLQKGEKKGNYNVIALGADEWFNKNVKIIDNEEFCKNPKNKHEKICQ